MRLSRLTGLCVLVFACQAVIACDDSEDREIDSPMGGSDDGSAGEGSGASGGTGASAGTKNQAGDGGSLGLAGENNGGGTDVGGMGQAGMGEAGVGQAGMGEAGMGGTGGLPECTTGADCNDQNSCTDDACTEGQCEHTNNTAACDDLSACTPGQDRCAEGSCSGTLDTAACPACNVPNK